jgi:ABC-2 type transport system ATP-binding protein
MTEASPLSVRGLSKSFGAVRAVRDVSFDVRRGECFGLLGPNGAGKTTTLSIVATLQRPDEGRVEIEGVSVVDDPRAARRALGLVPQEISLYDDLTAEENLAFFAGLYDLRGQAQKSRVAFALDVARLSDRRRDRVETFSGGMKRRLNFAVGLLHAPSLVLLDEPTAGVDPQSRNHLFEMVERLKAEGATLVYTTHYMEEAARLCDRVAIIDHGRLLALDTVRGLTQTHGGPPTLILRTAEGEERIETRDPLVELNRQAAARGAAMPADFEVAMPTLEQVFLHLTGRSLRD